MTPTSPPNPPPRGSNLRILIVTDNTSMQFGGEAAIPAQLFRVMRARGLDVRLVTHARTQRELTAAFPNDLDRITFIPDTRFHFFCIRLAKPLPKTLATYTAYLAMRFYTQLLARRLARKLVADHHIDIVHQPIPVSPKDFSLIHSMGAPVVMGPFNGGMTYPPAFRRLQSRSTAAIIRVARAASELVHRLVPGKPRASIIMVANERTRDALPKRARRDVRLLVENGVDLRLWNTSSVDLPPRADAEVRFVFVGRLIELKAVDLLLHAFKSLMAQAPTATLTIIGDGDQRPMLQQLSNDLGIANRVHFPGWKSQPECAAALRQSDVFVLPSLHECGGAVVLEAMCVGLPCIATAWGGPADYLDDSCGILVPPTSRDSFIAGLASAMQRLASNPPLRAQLGAAGRQRATTLYDWERKVDTILSIYADALAKPRR